MKGITPIISIIVLLLITVSLAGAAYMFLSTYMTSYTGQVVQVSGVCTGGTTAYVTVSNMGNLPIDLTNGGTECTSSTHITGTSGDCGDLTIVRTDETRLMDAYFDADTIPAADPGKLYKAVFKDENCTTTGVVGRCSYAFTRAGELQPVTVTVNCGG